MTLHLDWVSTDLLRASPRTAGCSLHVTEANYTDHVCYGLGRVECLCVEDAVAEFDSIPAEVAATGEAVEYSLDLVDSDRVTVLDDKRISAEAARNLLGTDLTILRARARRDLDDVAALLACRPLGLADD